MVRLKVEAANIGSTTLGYFNSTMVRLKVKGKATKNKNTKFQFHYGTIKRTSEPVMLSAEENFNSTMVRLKDHFLCKKCKDKAYFNSTMVRLKEATESHIW